MFVVCFGAGLGNQMFQYAFYLSLKREYPDVEVLMDIDYIYGGKKHNGFELDKVFGIERKECKRTDALILADYFPKYLKRYRFLNRIQQARRVLFGRKESFIIEGEPTTFYKELYELNQLKSYMFRGNWINEKYLMLCGQNLRDVFCFPDITEEHNKQYASQIAGTASVSVHIRRGDYLDDGWYLIDEKYVDKAVSIIEEKEPDAQYFTFTDDPEYVKQHYDFQGRATYVEGNKGAISYRDMQLMSMCKT